MRRTWLIPAVLTVALVGTGFWGYSEMTKRRLLEVQLSNQYQRSYFETVNYVEKVQNILAKSRVAGNPKSQAGLFADLWHQSLAAQENVNQLPINAPSITRTSKFLSQVGDYAFALNRQTAAGQTPGDRDYKQLNSLYANSVRLHDELQRVQADILSGQVSMDKLTRDVNSGLQRRGGQLQSQPLGLQEKQLDNYPTLIYDGPFSDHLAGKQPKGLTGAPVSATKAVETARAFIDNPRGWIWKVKNNGVKKGTIPAYSLELNPDNNQVKEPISLDISKTGGHVVYYLNSRSVGNARISMSDARERALSFLKSRGYPNLDPTYMLKQRNVAVISLAAKQGNVLLYPDLVKVQIALDDGQVIGFEATGYLMNHTVRSLPKPKITEEEVRRSVNSRLQIKQIRLALIPTEGSKEILTYEVKGILDQETYYVYVNVLTGVEEKILKVLSTPEGILTM